MDVLTTDLLPEVWPGIFHQLIITNSQYWLDCARSDPAHFAQETPQALRAIGYGLVLPEAWAATRDLIRQLNDLMMRRGQGIEWESYLTQAIARSNQLSDPVEIEFRLYLGNLYRLQGRLPEARTLLQTGLEQCDQYGAREHYWALLNLLAMVMRLDGRQGEARHYCQQVLDATEATIIERAEAYNVKGLVAYDQREWDDALDQLASSLQLYQRLDDPFQIGRVLTNRGSVLQRKGYLDEAASSFTEAMSYFHRAGDQIETYKAVTNLGNVYLMKKDYDQAIRHYQQALPVFQNCHFLVTLAHIYNNLGMAHTRLENWETAKYYFSASIYAWQRTNDRYNLANVLDNLGDMLIKYGQTQSAYDILTQTLDILNQADDSPGIIRLRGVIQNRLTQIETMPSAE
ncbi:MAG: tetratricopeptide repeat protein [Anaerolineae bacterium]|nr:tetratricopeptide repeat protein [Anaerolineae bacterium]